MSTDPATLPDRPPLDLAALAAGTVSTRWRVEVLQDAPSTNAVVAERARAGAAEGLVVVAEHQTAGRGRLDRVWTTPARSALTVSVLLTPAEVPVLRWPWLPLLVGVAATEAVRRCAGVEACLKWPNDVLVDGAKLGGILLERVEGPDGAVAVIGVGLNVSTTPAELPVAAATSLGLAGAPAVDRNALLLGLLGLLAERYDDWRSAGGVAPDLRRDYVAACDTIGREVRVELPGRPALAGRATGVDREGRLVVAGPAGERAVGAGDVVHVRRS